MVKPGKAAGVSGEARARLVADLTAQYEQGASIRALAETIGRSYGFVHRVLHDAHVPLRSPGRVRQPGPS